MTESTPIGTKASLYCRLGSGRWHRVLSQSEDGVVVDTTPLSFKSVWQGAAPAPNPPGDLRQAVPWHQLEVPLPDHDLDSWGYAFTYKEHRDETLASPPFRFRQQGPLAGNSESIPIRPHLDYELEIGLLMNRDTPGRFGYFLVNDLTDRGIQVMHYDEKSPADGFEKAKGFAGALRAGPLLAIGGASLWSKLTANLSLNGELRQSLEAADCNLDPRSFYREVFENESTIPWVAVATGTTGGTLFRLPKTDERVKAFLAGGFSLRRAKQIWLRKLRFLLPGDELILHSPLLGRSKTRLVREE